MAQTTVQNLNAVRLGSVKLEVGNSVGTLVDLGALTGAKMVETISDFGIQSDNAGEIMVGVADQKVAVTANWLEPDLTQVNLARGGIDTYSSADATPVPVASEVLVMATLETTGVRLAHKMAAGTQVTVTSIKDLTDVTTYDLADDYTVFVDNQGWTCIARPASGSTITDGQSVHVNYTYTPLTSKTLKTGGKRDIAYRVVRLTNTDDAGKTFRVTFYRARIKKGVEMTFKSDDATEANGFPIEIEATKDITRTVGDQLYEIVDEQGV
jgi:hypothetical protein